MGASQNQGPHIKNNNVSESILRKYHICFIFRLRILSPYSSRNTKILVCSSTEKLIIPLRVQVPNNHILTQNQYYNSYYPNPKYLIIGYMDPLGNFEGSTQGAPKGSPKEPEPRQIHGDYKEIIRVPFRDYRRIAFRKPK